MKVPAGVAIQLLGRPRIDVDGAQRLPVPQPQELGAAGVPAAGRAAADARPARLAAVRRGRRPAAGAALVPRRDPAGARRRRRRSTATRSCWRCRPDASVDVDVARPRALERGGRASGAGRDLLDGHGDRARRGLRVLAALPAPARLRAAAESILHEAALGSLSRGELERARDLAVRAAAMSPLDENHQALLIRLYRLAGDDAAASRQFAAWSATAERELGASPGAAVLLAVRERPCSERSASDAVSIHAVTEAGAAAVVRRRRSRPASARSRRRCGWPTRRGAEQLRGPDPAGAGGGTDPHARRPRRGRARGPDRGGADRARRRATRESVARARAELGYVDFLAGALRPGRAAARPGAGAGRRLPVGAGQGDDLPRRGRERPGRLPAGRRPARGCDPALPRGGRAAPRGVRPVHAGPGRPPAWRPRRGGRAPRRRGRAGRGASTGSRSCRGRRRCEGTCCWLAGDLAGAAEAASSSRSRGPARSATPAGRGSRRAGWPCWPRPPATPTAPSSTAHRRPVTRQPAGGSLRLARRLHPGRALRAGSTATATR